MSETTNRLNEALQGRYSIERELGEGGMAMVYLAEDVRHGRKVAIKVLKPELAAIVGGDRFLAEIKTTANLQHPHILPLFDSGAADGFLFYVMPFVEGESLRDKLDRERQLSVAEALHIAKAVASALQYAHDRDVVHRDIKPENILLHAGEPVVADFGIALALSAAGGGRMTETGLSLGTPHYMSPEQATADRDLSNRSDIYALACVLYEMLAGDPPHTGPTAQAILMRILTEDARALTDVRRSVPPHVAAVVTKGLEKLPADRFETAEAFRAALDDEGFQYRSRGRAAPTTGEQPRQVATGASDRVSWAALARDWRVLALALVAFISLTVAALDTLEPPAPAAVPTRVVTIPDGGLAGVSSRLIAISDNGQWIAWIVGDGGNQDEVYLRRADEPNGRPLPGTEGIGTGLVFSPDGEWIAFSADGVLKRVSTTGGPALEVSSQSFTPSDWGEDGVIRGRAVGLGLWQVPAVGGTGELFHADEVGRLAYEPELLPDGKAVIFSSTTSFEDAELRVLDLESGEVSTILSGGLNPHYVPTGHLIYGHADQALFAVPFDLARREVTGSPVPVLSPVVVTSAGVTQFAFSNGGTAVYQPVSGSNELEVVLLDAVSGNAEVLPIERGPISQPRFSPDGRFISYIDGPVLGDVYVYSIELGNTQQLTFEGINQYPSWSPDGRSLTFASQRAGSDGRDPFRVAADGSGTLEPLFSEPLSQHPQAWSPDGQLLFRYNSTENGYDLRIASFGGDSVTLTDYLTGRWDEMTAMISPDGRWAAYVSNQEGEDQVWVRSFPVPSTSTKVSVNGGAEPVWAPDGQSLFYRTPSGDFMAASVRTEPDFAVTERQLLLDGSDYYGHRNFAQYDVDPTTGRFVLLRFSERTAVAASDEIVVVTNWFEELKARMGGGG